MSGLAPHLFPFVVDVREIVDRAWSIQVIRADGIPFVPIDAGTERTGWAALPELDQWLELLGYARTGPWVAGQVLGSYKTTVGPADGA